MEDDKMQVDDTAEHEIEHNDERKVETTTVATNNDSIASDEVVTVPNDEVSNVSEDVTGVNKEQVEETNPDDTPQNQLEAPQPAISSRSDQDEDNSTDLNGSANTNGDSEQADGPKTEELSKGSVPQQPYDPVALQKNIEEKARQYLAKQLYRVIIPSYSAWYDRGAIHDIEKRSLPEFFTGVNRTKTPEVYADYRDFMIDTYRLNPTEYLTVTACRRNLAGDVAAIMRVHSFLEQWGLINYQIDPETRPSLIGPQYTGHFQVILDTPLGLQPAVRVKEEERSLQVTEHSTMQVKEEDVEESKSKSLPFNLSLRKSIYDNAADAAALLEDSQRKFNAVNTRVYNCFTCGDDVTKVRYHNLQSKQTVGSLCFKHGLFSSNMQSADFVKIEQELANGATWSDQEILLLLEAIEMYEDDWTAIAYHVGSRTKESCIVKFLQMPIEDPYFSENADGTGNNKKGLVNGTSNATSSSALIEKLIEVLNKPATQTNGIVNKAQELVGEEHQTQTKLITSLVEAELQKIELKLKRFEELEATVRAEQRQVDQARQQLYLDRLSLKSQSDSVLRKLQQAVKAEGEEAVDLAVEASRLAAENPQITLAKGATEIKPGSATLKPLLKPVSLDAPQEFKIWSA
ncbi:Rsc8p [Sugiyamaella lignohabitans]|uniref:Rsc8p n=1 Tax=Sugiyamaella lignohabitans TaxID=796027 RepID=A0A167FUB9_9ASCO|nr:Rsc8p [Sugiyamaella lignohabitans]ANB15713.1 Rsc8p [Sugiyamaella lignohabitans]